MNTEGWSRSVKPQSCIAAVATTDGCGQAHCPDGTTPLLSVFRIVVLTASADWHNISRLTTKSSAFLKVIYEHNALCILGN